MLFHIQALLRLLDVITEQSLQATCSITAARGRGKSAALGLAIAGAIGFGYSNIFVTSPAPENLKTLFEFIIRGLKVCSSALCEPSFYAYQTTRSSFITLSF